MFDTDDELNRMDLLADQIDPAKIDVKTNTKYLDRQIEITISSTDDATFNAMADAIEIFKNIWMHEMQRLAGKHSSP